MSLCLSWNNISCQTQRAKTILNHVSGHVVKGEMVALMGPSGSGKTTLLNVLSGWPPSKCTTFGDVFVNQQSIRSVVGYVRQDVTFLPGLTIRQHLEYLARLHSATTMTYESKKLQIKQLLETCQLNEATFCRTLSGGEAKRLAIASVLIGNAKVLLIDEPTSGLDPLNADIMMQTLVALKFDHAILLTIHRPTNKQMRQFTRLIYMKSGVVTFEGTGKVARKIAADRDLFTVMCGDSEVITFTPTNPPVVLDSIETLEKCSYFQQIMILSSRHISNLRIQAIVIISIIRLLIYAFLMATLWFQIPLLTSRISDIVGIMHISSTLFSVFQIYISAAEFAAYRPFTIHERRDGLYGITSYVTSFIVLDAVMWFIYPLACWTITYLAMGINVTASVYFGTTLMQLLAVWVGAAFGLLIGAIMPMMELANITSSTVGVGFILLSGYYTPHPPDFMRWSANLSYFTFTLRGTVVIFFSGEDNFVCDNGFNSCTPGSNVTGGDILEALDMNMTSWSNIMILTTHIITLTALSLGVLHLQDWIERT